MGETVKPYGEGLIREVADLRRDVDRLQRMPTGLKSIGPQFLGPVPACRVRATAVQTVPTATATALTFGAADHMTVASMFNVGTPSRITVPIPGIYRVGGEIQFDPNATGIRELWIQVNAVDTTGRRYGEILELTPSGSTRYIAPLGTVDIALATADWVALVAFQSSGGNLDTTLIAPIAECSLFATWVSNT